MIRSTLRDAAVWLGGTRTVAGLTREDVPNAGRAVVPQVVVVVARVVRERVPGEEVSELLSLGFG